MADSPDSSPQKPSLDEISSPEQLDQLMRVVKPKDFIPALTVGGLTLIALAWSVVGRIPLTVTGQGVLISPERVVELQSPIAGQLESLSIQDNQCVKKGEILATIKPTQLQENLRQQLTEIQAQLQALDIRNKRLDPENLQASDTQENEIAGVERNIAQIEQQIKERSQIKSAQEGCILEVSAVAGQIVSPGMRLGTLKTQEQGKVALISIAYFDVKDGKQIKPGMMVQITPNTVKRERFGGIVATVTSVSAYPVTSSRAAAKLGNAELADTLTGKTARVEIIAELVPEISNFSAYKWSSSKGPDMQLTPGTTTALRVKVEEQAPITFLLPFLRQWSGLQ